MGALGDRIGRRRLLLIGATAFGIGSVLAAWREPPETVQYVGAAEPLGKLWVAVRANLRAKFGLDDPLPVRYVRWLTAMLRGDWGFSFQSRMDVDALILQHRVAAAAEPRPPR